MSNNKVVEYGLWLGTINHLIAIFALIFACAASNFTCQGEDMKNALSIYAFTLLTPQVAVEAILILGLFLATSSLAHLTSNRAAFYGFTSTFTLLVIASLSLS